MLPFRPPPTPKKKKKKKSRRGKNLTVCIFFFMINTILKADTHPFDGEQSNSVTKT